MCESMQRYFIRNVMPRGKIDTRQSEYTLGIRDTRVHRAENIACTSMYAYTQVLYIHVHMLDRKIKWLVLYSYIIVE